MNSAPHETQPRPALRVGCLIDSLVTGGAERLAVTFAEAALQRPEIDLTLFSLSDAETPFRSELEALGTPIVTLPGRSLVDPARFLTLMRALRQHRTEILHAHLTSSTVLGAAAAALLRIPFVTTVHNVRPSTRGDGGWRKRLFAAALRSNRTTRIAVGEMVAEAARDTAGGKPFLVVPNAVSPGSVWAQGGREEIRRELGLAEDETALIAVGLIIGQKGYPDLIEAFARIAGEFPKTALLIVGAAGWPELKAELETQIAGHGLQERVRFLGLRRDVPRLLAGADIFISASHWEGAPVSLLEAMANGLPCVVTDVGDNRRTLAGAGAPVLPAGEPQALAEATMDIIRNPELRAEISASMRARVADEFGVDLWVDRLIGIYHHEIDQARGRVTS